MGRRGVAVLLCVGLLAVACGRGERATRVAGSSPQAGSTSTPYDPTAEQPGDEEACVRWHEEGARQKAELKPEERAAPDDFASRPYERGIDGFRTEPDDYLPAEEQGKLKDFDLVLAPRWLPEEFRGREAKVFGPPENRRSYYVNWPRSGAGGPEASIDLGVKPAQGALSETNVEIRGRPGVVGRNYWDSDTVMWRWDSETLVELDSNYLDYRVNCRELLVIARSVEEFTPSGPRPTASPEPSGSPEESPTSSSPSPWATDPAASPPSS